MQSRAPDLIGKQFGKYTVCKRSAHKAKYRNAFWECICKCGRKVVIRGDNLKLNTSKDCKGHHLNPSHGMCTTPEYKVWASMKTRCTNVKSVVFKYYGGRGIKVCKRWGLFENFFKDMGKRPKGLTLDRINNDGNYEPGNCRWATRSQQQLNRRR